MNVTTLRRLHGFPSKCGRDFDPRSLDSFGAQMVSKYLLWPRFERKRAFLHKEIITPEEPASPVTARMAGEERRLQILGLAVSLFSQHGFRGTTTREIAQAAGVSEAMVFRHFATKEELYAAILDHKACTGSALHPREVVGEALARKDDRAVFEGLAYQALERHEYDTEFHRLLLHAALEGHELAAMFWERNVRPLYEFLGGYIRERQRDGAMVGIDPLVIVRAFVGMVIHHSLNNKLWDQKRGLLNISNKEAARSFTDILLTGIMNQPTPAQAEGNGHQVAPDRLPESKVKRGLS
jgi:AcrR family transcriptional regulator